MHVRQIHIKTDTYLYTTLEGQKIPEEPRGNHESQLPPHLPLPNIEAWETRSVLKQCAEAYRHLAEPKGMAPSIPCEAILINTLALQEAKNSPEIENIVTTQGDLYKEELQIESPTPKLNL